MMYSQRLKFLVVVYSSIVICCVLACAAAQFDLAGPAIEVKVTRSGKALPISEVPNLQAGDRLWIHPALNGHEAVHYLLIAAFLRGSTNPPPEKWFTKVETWNKQLLEEGFVVTVPEGAEQALLFLAPQTGGDFSSLRAAVRGKPGSFVRASQDLYQAGLDRSRVDKYLEAIQKVSQSDPAALKETAAVLARSLKIKVDNKCFDKPPEQQAPCLTENSDELVLDDGHSQSMVSALTSGPGSDLIAQASATPMAGAGAYSPYVGVVLDVTRLLENFHTPQYQYIPALALPQQGQLNLKLNNPPSFRKPMSVLVVALPPVEAAQLPPLRPVQRDQVYCLQKPSLVFPVEGAPLIFSSKLGHDFALHVHGKSGKTESVPLVADAAKGGFVKAPQAPPAAVDLDEENLGIVQGAWGFDPYEGPTFDVRSVHAAEWTLAPEDKNALIVGREDTIHLHSGEAACVEQVEFKSPDGKTVKADAKLAKPDVLEVRASLRDTTPGPLTLLVKQYGRPADEIPLRAYAESSHLAQFDINAGDRQAVLRGTRLDEVSGVEVNGIHFVPAALTRASYEDMLRLSVAKDADTGALRPDEKLVAQVALNDGRVLSLQTTVEPPRPKLVLANKSITASSAAGGSAIRLVNPDDLPQDGKISFFVRSDQPPDFPRSETIEVATADGSFHTTLSIGDGGLVLQDAQTVMAVLDPLKSFGPSAFGPLQFRGVAESGAQGDWQPLATLVRVPTLKDVHCPDRPDQQCTLAGSNLFLIDSVASNQQFTGGISVPSGFANSTLSVPRPNGTLLYIKLRDDPSAVNTAALPVMPQTQP